MQTRKKLFSVILVIAMLIGMMPVTSFAADFDKIADNIPAFSDMPDDWSTAALVNAVSNGLMNGTDGKMMPDANLTRAQMATVIVRAFGATVKKDLNNFSDVKATDWYADHLAKAYQMGVIKGSDGKMNPNSAITRQEVFVILARAFKLQPEKTISKPFTDVNEISDWAKGEVYALVKGGYIQGANGKLNAKGQITRAEFAQILDNVLKQYINQAGEVTEVAVGNIMINTAEVTLKNVTVNGDLIIGDGVGDGEVTLDNVKITGRMVVRGGGINSIIIRGASQVSNVVVARVDGIVSVKVQGDANVEVIYIDDGSDDVNIEGTIGNIEVNAPDIVINAVGASIQKVDVTGENSIVIVDTNSSVKTVNIHENAVNAKVEVAGTVTTITTTAAGSQITGTGIVSKVQAQDGAKDIKIETPKTEIVVEAGVTGVTGGGGTPIGGGTTANNNTSGTGIQPAYEDSDPTLMISNVSVLTATTVAVSMTELIDVSFTWNGVAVTGSYQTNQYLLIVPGSKAIGNTLEISAVGYDDRTVTVNFNVPVWDGETRTYGWYTAAIGNHYLISTPADLAGLAAIVLGTAGDHNPEKTDFTGKTITELNNLDLNNKEWIPIGTSDGEMISAFCGIFDGNGKIISGLSVTGVGQRIGLFGYNKGTIKKITVGGSVTGSSKAGSIVGVNDGGTVSDCISNAAMTGSINVGGVAGSNINGRIENCTNNGAISSIVTGTNAQVGGIVGYSSGIISNCINTGSVTSSGDYNGGIAAVAYGTVENCKNYGNVSGNIFAGGIAGMGGMDISANIINCCNGGEINGIMAVGGIVGQQNKGDITGCFNTNLVRGDRTVGGIVGGNDENRVENCYNIGAVESMHDYVGGIVGGNAGTIKNCYSTGTITAPSTIKQIGAISGNYDTHFAFFANCYFLTGSAEFGLGGEISGSSPIGKAVPKSAAQLKAIVYNLNADVANGPWRVGGNENSGYPVLAWAYPGAALPQAQAAPTGLTGVAATILLDEIEITFGAGQGKITGVDATMEYKLKSTQEWSAVSESETEITGLKVGTYEVRYAAKEGYNASESVDVVVLANIEVRITGGVAADSILVVAIEVEVTREGIADHEFYSQGDEYDNSGSATDLDIDKTYYFNDIGSENPDNDTIKLNFAYSYRG